MPTIEIRVDIEGVDYQHLEVSARGPLAASLRSCILRLALVPRDEPHAPGEGAIVAALDQAATDMRKGYPGHGHPIEYVNGWEDAAGFAEGFASGDGPETALRSTETAEQPSAQGVDGSGPETGTAGVTGKRAREDA